MKDIEIEITDNLMLEGSGKNSTPTVRPAVEDPNDLHSKHRLRFLDMISEGEIEGLVDGAQSIWISDVPLEDDVGGLNYGGVTYGIRYGTPDQSIVEGFSKIENEISVSTQISVLVGPVTKTISDDEVDDVRITVSVLALSAGSATTGDLLRTSVTLQFEIKPSGGSWTLLGDGTTVITGKCTAPYARSIRFDNLSAYGSAPWDIRVSRITADSTSVYLSNDTYWTSYTEIKNHKLIYPDSAYLGFEIDAEYFGQTAPTRQYEIYGLKVQVPNNYYFNPEEPLVDGVNPTYSGIWDGTFKTAWSDNPAWIYYDVLNNSRYGLGIDDQYIDKWSMYTIGAYCDGIIDDGFGSEERRFTFNGEIRTRTEAFHVLNYIASSFRVMPYWASGMATLSQDSPKDPLKLFTAANVTRGDFEYTGTSLASRHTAAIIKWNDPANYYKPTTEIVQDNAGINRYGWNPIETAAIGCTSRGQAHRCGKWIIDSETNQTQMVKFLTGWYGMDCMPGSVIEVADAHYSQVRMGGRTASGTINQLSTDQSVTIEAGETYQMRNITTSGTLQGSTVTNSPGEYTTFDVSPDFDEVPANHSVWMMTASNLAPRQFQIITNKEKSAGEYEITGLIHQESKFARVEEDIYFEEPPTYLIPTGKLDPPANLAAEEYTYQQGQNPEFAVLLSWEHSPDARLYFYHIEARNNDEAEPWLRKGEIADSTFDLRPVTSGTWDFRVRAVGVGQTSVWVELSGFEVYADPEPLPDITGLQVRGGGSTFDGKDLELEWDTVSGTIYRFKDYAVEFSTIGDVLLRAIYTTAPETTYWYDWNVEDNGGTPIRQIKTKVWARDTYLKNSTTAATLVASNPIPTMAGSTPSATPIFTGLKVNWTAITPSDNDLSHYIVYLDNSTPPTTAVAKTGADTTYWVEPGLTPEADYKVQIEPHDKFGVGTKSNVLTGQEPLALSADDVDVELTASIAMTDSAGTTASGLSVLYDRDTTTSGITYTCSGTETWIQYEFGIEDYIDRTLVYAANAGILAYFALSSDGDAWNYYAGEPEETGQLVQYTTAGDAAANSTGLAPGRNKLPFPNRQTARYCRMYITNTAGYQATINELVFWRQVLAELIQADNLAAISADLGVVAAGVLQSQSLTTGSGIFIDLNNEDVRIGGSLNPDFSWNGANLEMKLANQSNLRVLEGGKIHLGDGNMVFDSTTEAQSSARIIIGEDGVLDDNGYVVGTGDYLKIQSGDIDTYKYFNGAHREFKALTKVKAGTVANNTFINIGYFPRRPEILLSPYVLQSYNRFYQNQNQSFRLEVKDLQQEADGSWRFRPYAQLVLAEGSTSLTIAESESNVVDCSGATMQTQTYTTEQNCIAIVVNFTYTTWRRTNTTGIYYYRRFRWRVVIDGTPSIWYYEAPGATISEQTITRTFNVSSGQHTIYLQACGENLSTETFGAAQYQYSWYGDTTLHSSADISLSLSGAGPPLYDSTWSDYMNVQSSDYPASRFGWTPTNNYRLRFTYNYSISLNATSVGSPRAECRLFGYDDWFPVYVDQRGQSWTNYAFHELRVDSGSWYKNRTETIIVNGLQEFYSVRWYLLVKAGSGASVSASLNTIGFYPEREFYTEVIQGAASSNQLTWNNITMNLGAFNTIADGSVNYMAIDGGQ